MNNSIQECVLCKGLIERTKYNNALWETKNFVVLADRLPVAEYHFIIVSKYHYINIWDVLHKNHGEELQTVINHIKQRLLANNKVPMVMFEHGQYDSKSTTGGKSVEHFHLHIVAQTSEVLPVLLDNFQERTHYSSLFEMNNVGIAESDYLLVSELNDNGAWIFTMKNGIPSQFMRTVLYSHMHKDLKTKMNIDGDYGYDWKRTNSTITEQMLQDYYNLLN